MRRFAPMATMLLLTSLKAQSAAYSSLNDQPPVIAKVLSAEDSSILFHAMSKSGVLPSEPRIGSVNLNAWRIECHAPVVPNPEAQCVIRTDEASLNADVETATAIYHVLVRAGAVLSHGPIGLSQAIAMDVSCHTPIVPQPLSRCELLVFKQ